MITEEVIDILDDIEGLANKIMNSELFAAYKQASHKLEENDEAHLLYEAFLNSKEKYDEVTRFGRYHPDYQRYMLETRKRKRAYEMLPVVMEYKKYEVALQDLIDEVITCLATAVSEHVKVEAGNPFFHKDKQGCVGDGSCACNLH